MLGAVRLLRRRRPNVEKLTRNGDIEGLRAALRHSEAVVDAEGVEWDSGSSVRVEAVEGLGRFYGPAVAEGLTEALDDPYPAVRHAAVGAISKLGVPIAVEPLVDCVIGWRKPLDAEARDRGLDALAGWCLESLPEVFALRLLPAETGDLEDRHRDALTRLLAADPRGAAASDGVAETLIDAIRTEAEAVQRDRAEHMLGWLGEGAGERLLDALADPDVPTALVRAAGAVDDSRAIDPLIRLVRGHDPERRSVAAAALGEVNDTRAVPTLLAATQDPSRSVRNAASQALNGMGLPAVIVGLAALQRAGGGRLEPAAGDAAPAAVAEPEGEPGPELSPEGLLDATGWASEVMHRMLEAGEERTSR